MHLAQIYHISPAFDHVVAFAYEKIFRKKKYLPFVVSYDKSMFVKAQGD